MADAISVSKININGRKNFSVVRWSDFLSQPRILKVEFVEI